MTGAGQIAIDPAGRVYFAECDWVHAAIHRIDPTGTLTTYAGTGLPGFTGDNGPAKAAQFYCVADIEFGPDGALYADDHVNNRIRRIDSSGTITTFAGSGDAGLDLGSWSGDGGPATLATLQEPADIVFDASGDLYISDRDNNRIRKVDTHGVISTIAGNGKTSYSGDGVLGAHTAISFPLGIVVDGSGNVIFADEGNSRVRMIDHKTGIITTIAGNGVNLTTGDGGPASKAGLADPQGLILDAAGNLYVEETSPLGFRRIDTRGRISTVTTIGSVPLRPADVPTLSGWRFGPGGALFVSTGTAVLQIDPGGTITLIAGVR